VTSSSQPSIAAESSDRIEIRLLGGFRVHRADGSLVEDREWRTAKTADLVCLLALRADRYVSVDSLLEALWPSVEPQRGRGSLRTAASQIRQVLGPGHLYRGIEGLKLGKVWVDALSFTDLTTDVRRLLDTGDLTAAAMIISEAVALYSGDLSPRDERGDWALPARRALSDCYQGLLLDAAETAVALGEMREAVEFAGRGLGLDPFSERAARALMRAHAGGGEVSRALREYDRFRRMLAQELGSEPSSETRQLYLRLLVESPGPAPESAAVLSVVPALDNETPETSSGSTIDVLGERAQTAQARLELAMKVFIPRRQFGRARLLAKEAFDLSDLPELRARAITAMWLPEILLGGARQAEEPLTKAAGLACEGMDARVRRRVDVLRCLMAHDLGHLDFDALWHAAGEAVAPADDYWIAVMVRIATERHDFDFAKYAAGLPIQDIVDPFGRDLRELAVAGLYLAIGQPAEATELLRSIVESESRDRATLLLPEALARLIMAEAATDRVAAQNDFDLLDEILGGRHRFARETVLRLMARAAIRAASGQPHAAAAAAAKAAEVAERSGLPFLAGQARDGCTRYLADATSQAAPPGVLGRLKHSWHSVGGYLGAWVSAHLGEAFWDLPLEALAV
jgi:DNA-binding SARP family transcriptional activator